MSSCNNDGDETKRGGLLLPSRKTFILRYLHENGGEATIEELSYKLACFETEEPQDVSDETVQHLRALIEYIYVPTLEDRDLITIQNDDVISLANKYANEGPTQETSTDSRSWWLYYFLAGTGLTGVLITYVLPHTTVSETGLRASMFVALTALLVIGIGRYNEVTQHG